MTQTAMQRIRDIISKIDCPHDFKCTQQGLPELLRSCLVDVGGDVLCSCGGEASCSFLLHSEEGCSCQCPLRLFLVKEFGLEQCVAQA